MTPQERHARVLLREWAHTEDREFAAQLPAVIAAIPAGRETWLATIMMYPLAIAAMVLLHHLLPQVWWSESVLLKVAYTFPVIIWIIAAAFLVTLLCDTPSMRTWLAGEVRIAWTLLIFGGMVIVLGAVAVLVSTLIYGGWFAINWVLLATRVATAFAALFAWIGFVISYRRLRLGRQRETPDGTISVRLSEPLQFGIAFILLFSFFPTWSISIEAALRSDPVIARFDLVAVTLSATGLLATMVGIVHIEAGPMYNRTGFLGWLPRPEPAELLASLWYLCGNDTRWHALLKPLRDDDNMPNKFEELLPMLRSADWQARFTTRMWLVRSVDAVLASLPAGVAGQPPKGWKALPWLLKVIAYTTGLQLAPRADRLLCQHCLCRMHAHPSHTGCRCCGQWQRFREVPTVVAVLDRGMKGAETEADGTLRVNWLKRNGMFDFDRVEIIDATDYDVEHFCIHVGNDTDAWRAPRYAGMQVFMATACNLSENTMQVLRSQFGSVETLTGEGATA